MMAGNEQPYTFDRVVRLILSACGIIGTVLLLRYLSDVLIPFAAAVVLAYLLNPMVTFLERRSGRRGLAVGITLTGIGIVGLSVVILLVPLMASQIDRFRRSLQELRRDVASSIPSVESPSSAPDKTEANDEGGEKSTEKPVDSSEGEETSALDEASDQDDYGGRTRLGWVELREAWAEFRDDAGTEPRAYRFREFRDELSGTYIGDLVEQAVTFVQSDEFNRLLLDIVRQIVSGGWTVVTWGINLLLGLIGLMIVLLYLVFLLLDFPEFARTWPSLLPPTYRDSLVEFFEQFNLVLGRYFRGQSIVALLTGTLFALGFTIIGLPMAVPFGLFVGLLNMVPYLQTVALVPAMFLALLRAFEGDSGLLMSVSLTLMVFAVVQVLQDGFIVPRVMGKAVGLRPVAVLLGLFIWGKLLGFLGLILAIPLTCLGIAYYRRYVLKFGPDARTALETSGQ
jgi:predicted PurR-regulated permease PerM